MPRAAASSVEEPQRRAGSPMPPGYVFVPKGNVYVTAHCRRRTREAHRTVYSVVGAAGAAKQPQPLGILVPREVARAVHADEAKTRTERARAVARHDAGLERRFRDSIARAFPSAPPAEVPAIVARAMQKGSRRVGRTTTLDVDARARLAVCAHIRHHHTDYEAQLRRRVSKPEARRSTCAKIDEIAKAWGGQVLTKKKRKKAKEGAQSKKNTKDQARKPKEPKKGPAVQAKEAPVVQNPGSPPVRTKKQRKRAAQRRRRKDKKRQEQQAKANAATTPATSTRARSATPPASSTWVTPTSWNWAAPHTCATPTDSPTTWVTNATWNWAPPALGTAAAPICIDDDETDEGEESDEYAWRGTDEDDYDSELGEDEYLYESDTAEDDSDSDISWHL